MPTEQISTDQIGELDDKARVHDLNATGFDIEHLEKDEQAQRSRGIDLLGLKKRKLERAQKKEAEKSELFKEINALIEGHGNVKDYLSKQRLEQDYGKGKIGQLNAQLACADLAEGPTFMQEAKARLKKMGIKTGITTGLGVVAGAALGGISWPVFLTAIAAGAAGRGTVEIYRLLKGDERRQKKELAKAEEATAVKITELIDECNEILIRKQADNPDLDGMSDPEYLKKYLEVVDLLHDSSKARVQVIGEREGKQYIALGKEEAFTEGAKQLNYGELRTQVRGGEKKAESVANWVSMISSLLAGVAAGAHEATKRAAEAGAAAKTTLENGGTISNVNLDGDQISHKVTLFRDAHNNLTDRLIYLKDHLHNIGDKLANGMSNPDMYTAGDVLIKNAHWHDIGSSFSEAIDMLTKAVSSGAYNEAWMESAKAILAAGSAYFGQAMAEPTVNLFSESDESKRKKLEQAMAKYKYVLGGSAGAGGSSEGTSTDSGDGEAGAGVPPHYYFIRKSDLEKTEGGEEEEKEISNPEKDDVSEDEISRPKAYGNEVAKPKTDINESIKSANIAKNFRSGAEWVSTGSDKKIKSTFRNLPFTQSLPGDWKNYKFILQENIDDINLKERSALIFKAIGYSEVMENDGMVNNPVEISLLIEIEDVVEALRPSNVDIVDSQSKILNEAYQEWIKTKLQNTEVKSNTTDDQSLKSETTKSLEIADDETLHEVDFFLLEVEGEEPIEINSGDNWSYISIDQNEYVVQIVKIECNESKSKLKVEIGGLDGEEMTVEEWYNRFSNMKKV